MEIFVEDNYSKMKNIAVILAGGIGARVGGDVPKQLLPLADGRSVLEHATEAFEQADCIDEVCIVMHPDYIAFAEQALLRNGWQKVKHMRQIKYPSKGIRKD